MDGATIREVWKVNRCGWISVDAQGTAGGLISMWCSKSVVMEDSWNGKFSSSVVVKDVGLGYSWVVTNVYGPNDARLRDEFWAELEDVRNRWDLPWCVGGDFNVIRFSHEKRGG